LTLTFISAHDGRGGVDHGGKTPSYLVVSCCDPTPLLDIAIAVFNEVTPMVYGDVAAAMPRLPPDPAEGVFAAIEVVLRRADEGRKPDQSRGLFPRVASSAFSRPPGTLPPPFRFPIFRMVIMLRCIIEQWHILP